jgi:hypothetical protein
MWGRLATLPPGTVYADGMAKGRLVRNCHTATHPFR